jgi:hypothetical protein
MSRARCVLRELLNVTQRPGWMENAEPGQRQVHERRLRPYVCFVIDALGLQEETRD